MTHRRPTFNVPERPITFNAAEGLGGFELAELWADRSAWPIRDRTVYDELAELACMSALARWLTRWLPIAIHSAMKAGAEPAAVARACGLDVEAMFQHWDEWAIAQRDFILNGSQGSLRTTTSRSGLSFSAGGVSQVRVLPERHAK